MTEGLIEGEHALRFVHPLVRSVIYHDLAPPLRQRWHQRAARMLDADGASAEEVTVHLLAAGQAGDPWVVAKLRRAAADASAAVPLTLPRCACSAPWPSPRPPRHGQTSCSSSAESRPCTRRLPPSVTWKRRWQ